MDGLGVTPEALSSAAAAITTVLGDGSVARPGMPGAADYGHAGLGWAVTEFGSAVALASGLLTRAAEQAGVGLDADARAYLATEGHTRATLADIAPAGPGGVSTGRADAGAPAGGAAGAGASGAGASGGGASGGGASGGGASGGGASGAGRSGRG